VQGDVKKARALTKEEQIRYQQTIQTALKEVDDALVSNQKAKQRVEFLGRHVAAVKESDRLAKLRFKGGSYTELDVMTADRKLLGSQNEEIHGVLDQYLALVSVYKALGGGWMVDQEKHLAANDSHASATAASANVQIPSATNDVAAK